MTVTSLAAGSALTRVLDGVPAALNVQGPVLVPSEEYEDMLPHPHHWDAVHNEIDKKFKWEMCSYSSAEFSKYHRISAHNL